MSMTPQDALDHARAMLKELNARRSQLVDRVREARKARSAKVDALEAEQALTAQRAEALLKLIAPYAAATEGDTARRKEAGRKGGLAREELPYPCPVQDCAGRMKREQLVCREDWYRLPAEVRRRVQDLYTKEKGSERQREAALAALAWLNEHKAKTAPRLPGTGDGSLVPAVCPPPPMPEGGAR